MATNNRPGAPLSDLSPVMVDNEDRLLGPETTQWIDEDWMHQATGPLVCIYPPFDPLQPAMAGGSAASGGSGSGPLMVEQEPRETQTNDDVQYVIDPATGRPAWVSEPVLPEERPASLLAVAAATISPSAGASAPAGGDAIASQDVSALTQLIHAMAVCSTDSRPLDCSSTTEAEQVQQGVLAGAWSP